MRRKTIKKWWILKIARKEKDKMWRKKLLVTLAHRKWDSRAVNGDIDNCCSRIQQKRNQIVSWEKKSLSFHSQRICNLTSLCHLTLQTSEKKRIDRENVLNFSFWSRWHLIIIRIWIEYNWKSRLPKRKSIENKNSRLPN